MASTRSKSSLWVMLIVLLWAAATIPPLHISAHSNGSILLASSVSLSPIEWGRDDRGPSRRPAREDGGAAPDTATAAAPESGGTETVRTGGASGGENRFVLSYSLYGSGHVYTEGMVRSARLANATYPGWEVRVYHDGGADASSREKLDELSEMGNVRLVKVTDARDVAHPWAGRVNPAIWRFLVASDPAVDAYAVRDSDSRPTVREKAAVDEWLESGRAFHIMHDAPAHHPIRYAPMLAGMWGGLKRAVPEMEELVQKWYNRTPGWYTERDAYTLRYDGIGPTKYYLKGIDQRFLKEVVWSLAQNDCLHHDSYYCRESGGIGFPMTREEAGDPNGYVGEAYRRKNFDMEHNWTKRAFHPKKRNGRYYKLYLDCLQLRRNNTKAKVW